MDIPITQSKEWQKLQDDLKETSFYEKTTDFQYLAIKKHTPVGNYLYLPYGPVLKEPESLTLALKSLTALAKKEKVIFIRIEPRDQKSVKYLPKTARKVKDLSPADTWVLDLAPDDHTLIKNFSQGTRTGYNTYAKKGLKIESTKNLDAIKYLVALQAQLFKKKHLTAYDEQYLRAELSQPFATLYLVKYQHPEVEYQPVDVPSSYTPSGPIPRDGQILAASLFFDYEGTRYYMQSATDWTYHKLPATVALLSTAIFDAKKKGIKHFDFWGIAPDDATSDHPWYGFTKFKKSFGGAPKHYAGTYDIVLNKFKYQLYHNLKKLKK